MAKIYQHTLKDKKKIKKNSEATQKTVKEGRNKIIKKDVRNKYQRYKRQNENNTDNEEKIRKVHLRGFTQ